MGDIEVWNNTEASLKKIVNDTYSEGNHKINKSDGAFCAPKIDRQMKDCVRQHFLLDRPLIHWE